MKSKDAISRSDRVLVAALAIVLATASTALGASLTNRPLTDQVATMAPVAPTAADPDGDMVSPEPPQTDIASDAVDDAIPAPNTPSRDAIARIVAEHECLSETIYYETRGNTDAGQKAVAEVVFNRLKSGRYGASICAVVYQGARSGRNGGCQFSWACNGNLTKPREAREWRRAQELAARIMTGEVRIGDLTGGAVGFHAVRVSPNWGPQFVRTVEIGGHIFYRRAGRSNGLRGTQI